jgi:hypothetical protein
MSKWKSLFGQPYPVSRIPGGNKPLSMPQSPKEREKKKELTKFKSNPQGIPKKAFRSSAAQYWE